MTDGNKNMPYIDKERTMTDCCKVVSDIESLKLLSNLTTDQALEVLRISELRHQREAMDRIHQRLPLMIGPLRMMADKLSDYVAYEHEGLDPRGPY